MKVLWLINYPLPMIAKQLGMQESVNEGWLTGLAADLQRQTGIQLIVCFPASERYTGTSDALQYVGYKRAKKGDCQDIFEDILKEYKPDVIHIMGTEFPHCRDMVSAAARLSVINRVLISIQGLVSECAKHYFAYLPAEAYCKGRTIRDYLLRTSMIIEQKDYIARGAMEIEALQKCKYVMGRTEWDKACVLQINPGLRYFHGGETLRSTFYAGQWSLEQCERHSLFVSQATYPLKGFHLVLEALAILLHQYKDCRLYVSSAVGYPLAKHRPRWRNSQYVNYICDLMKILGIEEHVVFLGALNAEQMQKQYRKANVFVSASSIENSSNSVGEAMLLGVPVVSSNVGGIPSLLENEKEGLLYPADDPRMLAHCIQRVFEDDSLTTGLGARARNRALRNHDKEKNLREVMEAYDEISRNREIGS